MPAPILRLPLPPACILPCQDLNKHQILPILLTGEPLPSDEQRRQHGLHTLSQKQRERYSRMTWPAAGGGQVQWRGQPSAPSAGGGRTARQGTDGDELAGRQGTPGTANGASSGAGSAAPASNGSSGGGGGGGRQRQSQVESGELEERLSPADYQRLLRERGLDCRGWSLVVAGHSLGSAVAAFVGMHFRSFCPGGGPAWAATKQHMAPRR